MFYSGKYIETIFDQVTQHIIVFYIIFREFKSHFEKLTRIEEL